MGPIKSLRAVSLLGCLILLLVACADQSETIEFPTPTPPPTVTPQPTRDPIGPTQTAQALLPKYVIERVTLATNVSADGEPREAVTMVPLDTRNIYLSVLLSEVEPPLTLRAYWFEGKTILAQSEQFVSTMYADERWVSLGFQSQKDFDPAQTHTVELRINDQIVNTYTFRVGEGALEDVIAEAQLGTGIDDGSQLINEGDEFTPQDAQIVALIRISNKVDPNGMIFSAFLKKDDQVIQQRAPSAGQPTLQPTPQPQDRLVVFSFDPDPDLELGDYTIEIMINGVSVQNLDFEIVDTPRPTPTPSPTPTSEPQNVQVSNLMVAEDIDSDTQEPIGGRVSYWIGDPNERKQFYVAVELRDLTEDDVVEIEQLLDGEHVNTLRYPSTDLEFGWLAVPVNIWMPDEDAAAKDYTFVLSINGEELDSETLTVESE